jgi:hypothetical protein
MRPIVPPDVAPYSYAGTGYANPGRLGGQVLKLFEAGVDRRNVDVGALGVASLGFVIFCLAEAPVHIELIIPATVRR